MIYDYIKSEEARADTEEIKVGDNWSWNFKKFVQMIFHLKNGVFFTGENNFTRAFKNIIEPILNLAYWAEDIEVKDVVFYIENSMGRVLSFFVKKYHDEIYVKEHNLDTLFDEITESDLDYGGVLVEKTNNGAEVKYLQSITFCDQTNIKGGPIGYKMSFSPDKLRQMSNLGWGDKKNGATVTIEELITLADTEKSAGGNSYSQKNRTSGKQIEVYIVKGSLPEAYLEDNDDMENWFNQIHIVAYYQTKKGLKGQTLYRKKWNEDTLKFHTSAKIYGRALGRGEGEALLPPQVWTNFLEIHKMQMLEGGAKNIIWSDDPNFANRNKINDLENNEVTTLDEGKRVGQVPMINPLSVQLYERSINEWFEHAQLAGSAFDPVLGKQPSSGTTFRGQERTVFQGRGLHERRRGQRAKFIEEMYRDWFIPDMKSEILKGKKFLATLTSEEMQWVTEQLAENLANRQIIEQILDGQPPEEKEVLIERFRSEIGKKGNKHVLEILKGEFEDVEIKMGINVAAKQKDLMGLTDKVLSIFQFAFVNPQRFQQVMQIRGMSKAFNDLLEFSGVSPVDFAGMTKVLPQVTQPISSESLERLTPETATI